MAAVSIEEIVSQAQNFATQAAAGAVAKKEAIGQAKTALTEQNNILNLVAQDMTTVKATQEAAALKTQSQIAGQAAAVGISGEDSANYLIQLATRQKAQNEKLAGQLETITQKTSVDFLDSPLQWVGAQITLPKEEEIARAQIAQVQQTHQAIQQTTQTFSAASQTYKLQEQNVTQASATAATRIAASSALISAQQTQIESAKYNVEEVNATLAASSAELQAAGQIYQAQNTQEGQRMQQVAFDADAQQREFQQEMRQEAIDLKKSGKAMDDSTLNYLNLSLTQAGLPAITAEDAPIFLSRFKSGDPEVMQHWRNGRVISTQPVSKTRMGGTIAESAEFMSKFPTNLDGLRKDTAALIMSATSQIPIDKTTPKAKADWLNSNVQAQVDQQYANISKGSMFDAGEVSQYFGISDIQQLPLVSKVLAPLSGTGVKLDEPSLVLNAGLAAMKAGTLTSTEFSSGIEQLYRKASMTNIAFRDLKGFGIKLPAGDLAYNAKIDRWGKPVNLLNPVQVNRWVVEKAFEVQKNQSLMNSTAPMGMRNFSPR